jgi:hypothetical protein
MKKSILSALLIVFGLVAMNAQTDPAPTFEMKKEASAAAPTSGPIMTFEAMEVDYGVIEKDSEPLRVLNFTNTGTEPLVIKNARGSCGCTVPVWPKEPIMPGQTDKIEVRYATNRIGKFSKKITFTTNEAGDPKVVKVLGKVLKPEESQGVPAGDNSLIKPGGE